MKWQQVPTSNLRNIYDCLPHFDAYLLFSDLFSEMFCIDLTEKI